MNKPKEIIVNHRIKEMIMGNKIQTNKKILQTIRIKMKNKKRIKQILL